MLDAVDRTATFAGQLVNAEKTGKPFSPPTLKFYEEQLAELERQREQMRGLIARWWTLSWRRGTDAGSMRREAPMRQWDDRPRLQAVQFEWEDEPQLRGVRLVNRPARVGDLVLVSVAGVEVEGRIEAVESSTLRVRIGRRLF